ncbi:tandem-95 repeat protein, partial [Polaribacter marinaquae]
YSVDNLGNVTFDPADNFNGPANINYTIQDNDGTPLTSNVATIGITVTSVNDNPVVVDEVNSTTEDTQLIVTAANGLLTNDSDLDGDPLSIATFEVRGNVYTAGETVSLTEGSIEISSDGSYIFTPATNFNGVVPQITYNVTDGSATVPGTLDITVTPVNDAPIAVNDLGTTTLEDTDVTVATIGNNDTDDVAVDPSTVTLIDPNDPTNTGNTAIPLLIAGVGTYSVDNLGNVTFDPADNFNGPANINYTIQDNDGTPLTSNVATIGITVTSVNDNPVVVDEVNSTTEDAQLIVTAANGLLTNDSDLDGDPLSIAAFVVDGTTYGAGETATFTEGVLKITSDGGYTFTPASNFNGTVPEITYNVTDGSATVPGTLDITVTAVNDAPVAIADSNDTNEDTPLTVSAVNGILANDTDLENDTLTVTALTINGNSETVGAPISLTEGVLQIESDGSYTFTPTANFNGDVPQVTYTANDGLNSVMSTLDIVVNPINDAPIAVLDTNTTNEDTPLTVTAANGLLTNDSDTENSSLSVTTFTVNGTTYIAGNTVSLAEGSLLINSDGSYTFTPIANFNGSLPQIAYTITDGANTANSTLDISVSPINDAPVATNDVTSTDPGVAVVIAVLPNDTDIDGDVLNVSSIVTQPANGTVVINGDNTITYTPNPGFNKGSDSFEYQVCDTNGLCDSATVNITVPKSFLPPVANPDAESTSEDVTLTVDAVNGLLNNDTDSNPGETLTVVTFQIDGTNYTAGETATITEGQITINADGSYTFVPTANYNGSVPVINYTISDGTPTDNSSSTLTLNITPVNDVPVAIADTKTTPEDVQLNVDASAGLLINDSDTDGTPLTLTQFTINGTDYAAGTTVNLVEGAITVNGDGSYIYNPATDFLGAVPQVTYTVTDGSLSTTSTLDISVTGVNDAPVAVDDLGNTSNEDAPVNVSLITNNDTDDSAAIDATTIILIDPNNAANTGNSSNPLVISGVGSYSVDTLGNVVFTPLPNFNGVADIKYTVEDNEGLVSNEAVIGITITAVNDAPNAVADVNTTAEDTVLAVNASNGLLINDNDVEGTPLTILEFTVGGVDTPAGNTISLTEGDLIINSDGSYTFTPALDFTGNVPQITYTVSDGNENSDATLDITVTGENDAPVAGNDTETTIQNTPVTIATVTANDTDTDGTIDASTITLIDPNNASNTGNSTTPLIIAGEGTYTVDNLGNIVFTPELEFTGEANVIYTVEDNNGLLSNEAQVTVTVLPDTDGDGIIDSVDLDDDNDGISDVVENGGNDPLADTDNDGIPDYKDPDNITLDENNDGIDDNFDKDKDGIIDQFDNDSDNDGISDLVEAGGVDADGDGKVDNFTDTNNDGLDDAIANNPLPVLDSDGDGVPNYKDLDSDADGIIDNIEAQNPLTYVAPSGVDTDKDGIDDAYDLDCAPCGSITGSPVNNPENADSDALPNYLDLDSDNDGIVDNIEWQTTVGYIAPGADSDGNGLADVYETAPGSGNPIRFPLNTDGIDPPDYTDVDSDGDGVLDTVEAYDTDGDNVADNGNVFSGVDSDGDGLDDAFDLNTGGLSDQDAASNNNQDVTLFPNDQDPGTAEVDFRDKITFGVQIDTDGDGITDDIDIDDDNDGIVDVVESLGYIPSSSANDPRCILPNVSFQNPTYVAGTGVSGSGSIGAKYRFENVVDVTGFGGTGGILDAIVEITDIKGGASLISIDNSTTGNPDAWQPEYTVPTPTGNKAEMAFRVTLVNDNTNTLYNISRFSGAIFDIDGANARESVILSRPGLYAVDNETLLNVTDNPATGLVTFEGPDDTYAGVDVSPRLATYFGYYNTSAFDIRFSAELLSASSNTNLGSVLFSGCAINGLFEGNTASSSPSQTNGTSENSGPGTFPLFTVNDGIDSDGDGISDDKDIDSDNDGIPDNVEAQTTAGYIKPISATADADMDGLIDAYDNNAVISGLIPVDTEGDFNPDYLDLDSDNDGLNDTEEAGFVKATVNNDSDADGLLDSYDDNNTAGALFDVNDDQDNGAIDLPDLDNTSTPEVDYREIKDNDNDGVPDSVDLDDDNDGIPDSVEQNGDPLRDTDKDGIPDSLDLDSDGDGISDLIESGFGQVDLDNDGRIDGAETNSGANGLFDAIEDGVESGTTINNPQDSDKDGVLDFQDIDDDNDGINTLEEDVVSINGDPTDDDSDNDGIPNYLDEDDDNDGVLTKDEDNNNNGNFNDDDDNNDGTPDYLDSLDTDNDGIPDSEDLDDDNDGNPDSSDPNPLVPAVSPETLTVVEGLSGVANVLANDDYLPGANTTITDAGTGTAAGVVSFDPLTGEMTYTPAEGEEGTTVTVDYTVCNTAVNPSVCKTTAVTITVQPDNDNDGDPDVTDLDDDNDGNLDSSDPNPLVPAVSPDVLTVVEGLSGVVNVLANDDYLPGTNTTITDAGTGTAAGVVSFDPLTGEMTYTPAVGEEGTTVTVDYTVCNTAVNPSVCKTTAVTITVQPDNDNDGDPDITDLDDDNDGNPDSSDPNPLVPTVSSDVLTVVEGLSGVVNVLANDDYLPGTNTTLTDAGTGTAAGVVSFDPLTGEMTYTPAIGEEGTTLTVDYTVCNTAVSPSVCRTETVTITVQSDNDNDGDPDVTDLDDDNDGNPDSSDPNPLVPTVSSDVLTVVEGLSGVVNVLANDDYLPGTNTTLTDAGTGTATGVVSFNPLTGEMTYTPAIGEEGTTVTIDYTVCNTAVSPSVCKTETVTITVQPDNDNDGDPDVTDLDDDNDGNPDSSDPNPLVPTVSSDVLVVTINTPGVVNVLANDDYLPGTNTTLTDAGTGTAAGVVSFDPLTGEMTYIPAVGEEGTTVTIDYTVCNTAVSPSVCKTETVTITVEGDTDGDGIPNNIDLDDDNDGIPDSVEQNGDPLRDTDNDGIPDHLDLDSDGDGVNDVVEAGNGALDADNDGVIDGADTGSGSNGLFDGVEVTPESGTIDYTPVDTDKDGKPDFQDTDDDGDGVDTIDEDVVSVNGDPTDDDTDKDGIPNYLDTDDDGDGIDTSDEDVALINGDPTDDDTDKDGIPNYLDTDDDGDGIETIDEDNNGDSNLNNDDDDLDGIPDYLDADDTDGDGVPDSVDLDDDNDGIPDFIENGGDNSLDTDSDGIPDHLDLDSDGDSLTDLEESGSGATDANNDGVIDGSDTGSGLNGLFNDLETFDDSGILSYIVRNTDSDDKKDFQDIDDDNDGILTIDEYMFDCDNDQIQDHMDVTNCDLVPNAFSPNGDGNNDTFVIPALANYPNFKLEISNRWGNKVYEYSNNGKTSPDWWDGYSTGRLTLNDSKPVPTGTYFYIIYFNDGVRKPITGWVYLNR